MVRSVCENCGHQNTCGPTRSLVESSKRESTSPSQLRASLKEVMSSILQHKAYLDTLEQKRDALERELSRIIYPVLQIPSEIVSLIFAACLPSHGRVRPSPITPPLSLAQICRHWRHIALSSPELWSSLDLLFRLEFNRVELNRDALTHSTAESLCEAELSAALGSITECPNEGAVPLLETWFLRAKSRPLSLTIRSEHSEIPAPILSLISLAAGRLSRLELNLPQKDFQSLGRDHILFPRLRHLTVLSDGSFAPLSGFKDTPSLSELRIEYTQDYDFPTSLTSLELDGVISFETLLLPSL
ncbi:hypothetical protein B0H19DRAFT_1181665 [Mycena capillaripes]|nr:hypothetical protein B0H19DRAFT_1181665 [Mycena capillaripes]